VSVFPFVRVIILQCAPRRTESHATVLYGFSIAYVAAPWAGMPFDSAAIVDFVHQLPEWSKYAAKTILAAPFAFHSFNGVRHLLWDSGKCECCLIFTVNARCWLLMMVYSLVPSRRICDGLHSPRCICSWHHCTRLAVNQPMRIQMNTLPSHIQGPTFPTLSILLLADRVQGAPLDKVCAAQFPPTKICTRSSLNL